MAAINRPAVREHLWPGIYAFFGAEYSDYEDQYQYIFDTHKSTKAYEEYVMESMFGLAPIKAEGSPTIFEEGSDVWKGRVEMVAYALGFVITREAISDDQYFDLVPRYTRALKRSMKITKEVRAATFVDQLFTLQKTGDGVSVVNPAHPLKNGGTFSNQAGANADLNETSLEAAIIQIRDYVDEKGLPISVQPQRMIVPNGLTFTADRLMNTTTGRVGTGDNDKASAAIGMVPGGYKVNNYLGDPQAWFLKTDVPDGMTHWDREALDLEEVDGSETQVLKVLAYERYAESCQDPRGIWGSPGQ